MDDHGRPLYPDANRLLVTADAGGSNGSRARLWKVELQRFADETGLYIAVCHFPPGTSKWNKIEHRLFSAITMNWRGKPLESPRCDRQAHRGDHHPHRAAGALRARHRAATPRRQVCDAQMATLYLQRHAFHGDWNYTLIPRQRLPLADAVVS